MVVNSYFHPTEIMLCCCSLFVLIHTKFFLNTKVAHGILINFVDVKYNRLLELGYPPTLVNSSLSAHVQDYMLEVLKQRK